MPTNLEQIGTEAIVKGFNAFMSQMQSMDGQYQKTAGTFTKQSGKASSAISGMIGNVVSSATGFALATKGLDFVLGGIQRVTTALPKLAISAAPLPGIAQAFNASTQKTGVSLEALRGASRGTVADFELMRTANVALTGAGEMLGQEMGQKLPGLMEIARASAKATGKDVNFLFDSLVSGVKRGSPMLIDNTGLVLKLGEANATMAAEVGIAVEDLTAEQKQVALLNATLEAGQGLVSQFGAEQASAAENLAAIRAQTQNVTDTIGLALQSALITITGTIASLVERFSDAIQEGGALYPVLVNLGAALSIVADAFSSALNWVIQWVSSFQSTLFGGMNDTASGMLNYGVEIVASLAEGIVSAASTILIQAMNFIGSVLSSWLAPGSPPKVAPELDKWGAGTFTEYLKGFGEADFSVLDTVQNTLKKYMSGADFASISADLARGLSTGEVDDSFFASLRAAAGDLGPELERLVRDELQLADAIEQVRKAEESLTKAQEAESDAQEQIEALTDEYNELLRTGASKELLKAKLLEINAAEKQKSAARAQRREAEGVLSTAEDQAGAAQEQVDSQKQILTQLEEMVQEQKAAGAASTKQAKDMAKLTKGLKGAGKAAAALAGAFAAPMGMGGLDIAGRMSEAIDAAKEALQGRLGDLFAPLGAMWQRSVEGPLAQLATRFFTFRDQVAGIWPVIQLRAQEAWSKIQAILGIIGDILLNQTWPQIQEAFNLIGQTLGEFGITWSDVWDAIQIGLQAGVTIIGGLLAILLGAVIGLVNGVASALGTLASVWSIAVDSLRGIIEGFATWFAGMSEFVQGILTLDFPRALEGFQLAWQGTWDMVSNILRFLLNGITGTLRTIISFVGGWVRAFIGWFQKLYDELFGQSIIPDIMKGFTNFINFLKKTLGPAIEWFVKNIVDPFREGLEGVLNYIIMLIGYVKKLKNALKKTDDAADDLSGHSPSPLEKGLRGAGRAMQAMYRVELPRLQKGFQMQAAGAGAQNSTVVNNTRNVTYNLAVNTTQGAGAVTSNYHMMRAMAGVS